MASLFAYVGCYTSPERGGRGKGINVYRVDRRTGAFAHVQILPIENPSFLAFSGDGRHLYSIHGDRSEATSFKVDPRSGELTLLNRQPTGGYNPIHLALDATGRFLVVANYGSDSTAVLPIHADGSLGAYSTLVSVKGKIGPHRREQNNIRPHHNPLDPTGTFFYLPCKGGDSVITCRLDRKRGVLVHVNEVASRPGAGPRHIAFHPRKALAYVINELDSTITTYRQDRASGALKPLQTVPSTPEDFTGYSTGAEIAVDKAGRHVYVSNRGHDSVGVFAIDSAKGTLRPVQWVPSGGSVPRFFAFDPAERFLYSANQGGDSILTYRVGRKGPLSPAGVRIKVASPACIVFTPQ